MDHETEEEALRPAPAKPESLAQRRRHESGGDDVGGPVDDVGQRGERMEHRPRDESARGVRYDRGLEHVALVPLQITDRRREQLVRDTELAGEDLAFIPIALAVRGRKSPGDELIPAQRRQHERRLHPQEQLRVLRAVAVSTFGDAAHRDMSRVDAPQGTPRSRRRSEDRIERRVGRPVEPAERIASEVRVLVDTRGHEGMCYLKQHRRRAAESGEQLAVQPARDRVARKDPDVRHTRSVSLIRSFGFAFEGVSYLIRTQRNVRIEIAIGVVVLIVAAWVRVTPVEWAVLVLTIAMVLAMEALNTAIELAVTLASPERHPLAKAAKDVSAAMVLIAAIASVVVGLAILGPRLALLVS
jgi:diacylglycerol kinase